MNLKNIVLIISVFLLFSAVSLAATHSLTIDTRGSLIGTYSTEYEQALAPNVSLGIQGQITNLKEDDTELKAFGLAAGRRQYIGEQSFSGPYWGAYGTLNWMNISQPQKSSCLSLGVAGSGGFKLIIADGMVLDVGLSMGAPLFSRIEVPGDNKDETVAFGAIGFGLTVGMGYAW